MGLGKLYFKYGTTSNDEIVDMINNKVYKLDLKEGLSHIIAEDLINDNDYRLLNLNHAKIILSSEIELPPIRKLDDILFLTKTDEPEIIKIDVGEIFDQLYYFHRNQYIEIHFNLKYAIPESENKHYIMMITTYQ